jgi:tRNA A-37 threonylcarbamoyl transferase component Bud32
MSLLKEPNVRGRGTSTVRRGAGDAWPQTGGSEVVSKVQTDYYCRPLWNWGRRTPLVARERRALLGCRKAGVHVPRVVEYREVTRGAELITTFIPNALNLDIAAERFPAQRAKMFGNAGVEIGKLHRARWTHGALYSTHILVCPQSAFRVYLIDLEKGRRSLRVARDLVRFERHNRYLTEQDWADFRQGYDLGRSGLNQARPD